MSARMKWLLYHRYRNLPHSLYVEAFTSTRGVCFWGVSWCWGKAHPYPQAITGPLATTHNLFGSIVRASAQKESKDMVVFSVSVDSIPNKNQAEMHGTALSSLHIIAQRLEDSCASLQARRQIICNKSLSCDIGGLKSIFTSLWCVSLEDLCALPKPTKRKGYEYVGARPCIASLPISFLPILNSAPRRMRLAWVWIWYRTSVASSASCRATSLKSWLMKNHRVSSDSGASIHL